MTKLWISCNSLFHVFSRMVKWTKQSPVEWVQSNVPGDLWKHSPLTRRMCALLPGITVWSHTVECCFHLCISMLWRRRQSVIWNSMLELYDFFVKLDLYCPPINPLHPFPPPLCRYDHYIHCTLLCKEVLCAWEAKSWKHTKWDRIVPRIVLWISNSHPPHLTPIFSGEGKSCRNMISSFKMSINFWVR